MKSLLAQNTSDRLNIGSLGPVELPPAEKQPETDLVGNVSEEMLPFLNGLQIRLQSELLTEWSHFKYLLERRSLDENLLAFLDGSISQTSLRKLSDKLENFSFTQEEFISFVLNFAEGLQHSVESFKIPLPEIELGDGQGIHADSIHYHPVDRKIRIDLKAIERFTANPKTAHLLQFDLLPKDLAYFAGWEEGTHFAQFSIESKQQNVSQEELSRRKIEHKIFLSKKTNYMAVDPHEVYAGFIIREEFRRVFSEDELSVKLSYRQDLYVLKQIGKSRVSHEGMVGQLIEEKKKEMAELTSGQGQFPGLKPTDFGAVENLKVFETTRAISSAIGGFTRKADIKSEEWINILKQKKLLKPIFAAQRRFAQFSENFENNFEKWIQKRIENWDKNNRTIE